jgi:hypothetical protein
MELLHKITAPIVTVSELNERQRWKAYRRRKMQRRAIGLILNTRRPVPHPPLLIKFIRISPRKLDPGDNLNSAFKAIRDELCVWLGVDDGSGLLAWEYEQRRGRPGEQAIEIQIRRPS